MKKLKDLRIKHNLTQKELGKIIGVSRKTVSSYELGYRRLSVDRAKRLGDRLKFNWWELFE